MISRSIKLLLKSTSSLEKLNGTVSTSAPKKTFKIEPLPARYISTIKQQDLIPQKKQKKIFEDKVYNSLIRVSKISSHSYASLYHRSFVMSANFILLGISWINEIPITYSIFLSTLLCAFSKILLNSHQITAKFFAYPINVIQFSTFDQGKFNDLANRHAPTLIKKTDGYCKGHVLMWHLYKQLEENYIQYLHEISSNFNKGIPLNEKQIKLLRNISEYQTREFNISVFPTAFDSLINNSRQHLINSTIDKSVDNPGALYGLLVTNSKVHCSHIIGIMTNNNQIAYFDPNGGEYMFNDISSAKISLSRHLAYVYGGNYPELSRYPHSIFWHKSMIPLPRHFDRELRLEPRTIEEEKSTDTCQQRVSFGGFISL